MTVTRIHPGFAVLAFVAGLVAALLILQGSERRPITSGPQTAVSQVDEQIVPHQPAPVVGIARVVDGDTIVIQGSRIRLYGIDAPESKQTCELNSQSYPCGTRATEALIGLLSAKSVQCIELTKDRNGRPVSRCRVDSIDVGGQMVEDGWAVAFRKYSMAYVDTEERARIAKRGMWAGTFITPEEWRRTKR